MQPRGDDFEPHGADICKLLAAVLAHWHEVRPADRLLAKRPRGVQIPALETAIPHAGILLRR